LISCVSGCDACASRTKFILAGVVMVALSAGTGPI